MTITPVKNLIKRGNKETAFKVESYSTISFIQDLINEIGFQPEALAKIFPERVFHFSQTDLSQFWKGNDKYVDGKIYYKHKVNQYYEIKKHDLELLEKKVIDKFGTKSLGLVEFIRQYSDREINMDSFFQYFQHEMGRVSGELKVSKTELSYLFGMQSNYIGTIFGRLQNLENRNYNPSFAISKEVLAGLADNLGVLKFSFRKVLDLINRYISSNPNLKEYSGQQYTITNPNFFSDILQNATAAYWFGFLCADGWVSNTRNNYEIGSDLSIKDLDHLKKFGEIVGFDESRILHRIRIQTYKSEIKIYEVNSISFSCKTMYNTLTKLGFLGGKSSRKGVPSIIQEAIRLAKKEIESSDLHWSETSYGRIAHAWLLGFYDGDGRYMGSDPNLRSTYGAQIYAANKELLEQIRELFEIKNEVRVKTKPGEEVFVFDNKINSKGFWRLTLGSDVFKRLLRAYLNSLYRKRP